MSTAPMISLPSTFVLQRSLHLHPAESMPAPKTHLIRLSLHALPFLPDAMAGMSGYEVVTLVMCLSINLAYHFLRSNDTCRVSTEI
jgi:hypothetical protein